MSDTQDEVVTQPEPQKELTAYSFPTIGDGMTIWAASQDEANQKAQKILSGLSSQ